MDPFALYRHRQIGWAMLISILLPLSVLVFAGPIGALDVPTGKALAALGPLIYLVLLVPIGALLTFSTLEVSVMRDQLMLRFGPGLFTKRFAVPAMRQVTLTRTRLRQGWGLHRRGSVTIYNVSGLDAVRIDFDDGSTILVGSDEAALLAATLHRLVAARK